MSVLAVAVSRNTFEKLVLAGAFDNPDFKSIHGRDNANANAPFYFIGSTKSRSFIVACVAVFEQPFAVAPWAHSLGGQRRRSLQHDF
jgi:hypothetical protein